MSVFNIAGIAVSTFFILFILSKKKKKRADLWLILINLLMIGFLIVVMLAHEHFTLNRFFLQTQIPFYLFPVLLLFSLETLQKKTRLIWLLLFLPAVVTTICIGADLYFINDYKSPELLQGVYNHPPFFYHLFYKGNQVFFISALVWLIKRLKNYKKEIKDNFSFTDPIELNWLSNVCWIFLILICISLTTFLLSNFRVIPIDAEGSFSITSAGMAIVIFYLSFQGIRQYSIAEYYDGHIPGQAKSVGLSSTGETFDADAKEKYRSSSLTQIEQESIYGMVLKLFENDSIYQESKLQLQDVSDILKIPASSLSQTINTLTGKPFYDFVNGYRVKYLQKLLADPGQKRFTILALGLESGFNSKASLNRVFKEHTGLSPSAYQRRHLLQ